MGQIIGSAAKPKRCNLSKLSQLGTPAAGEYILVSSDNSMNAAGQGNFDCYIVGDGQKAATALKLKSVVDDTLIGAFDISAYHATGDVLAKYVDLTAALDSNNGGGVPQSLQKGGMSVKFVQSSDNKYVQYRLMATSFSTTPSDWQGVDDEPTIGSDNLVKSGGVYEKLNDLSAKVSKAQTIVNDADLDVTDMFGNVLTRFSNGHIKTKNFDSSQNASTTERGLMSPEDKQTLSALDEDTIKKVNDNSNNDLNICDPYGEVLASFSDGHFKTKNFNSRDILSNSLKGKKISILGDSISTYSGYIPSGNATFFPSGDVTSVEDTWWKMLIDELGLTLETNNSWSGSRVADGSEYGRTETPFCGEGRYNSLGSPDIILVFGGVNDCSAQSNPQQLGELNTTTTDTFDKTLTAQAFQFLAVQLTTLYQYAKIYFMIPLQHQHPNWKNANGWGHIELRNDIKAISDIYGINIIETNKCGMDYYNRNIFTIDGLHPNKAGHELIKNYVKGKLLTF